MKTMKIPNLIKFVGLGTVALAFAWIYVGRADSVDDQSSKAEWSLVKIVDGDTIDVKDSTEVVQRVRLVGIDTAERGECGFSEASQALAEVIGTKKFNLVLADTEDKDRYGRLLRYVDVEGQDVGLELIRDGYAVAAYDSRTSYPKRVREDMYILEDEGSPDFC